MLHRKMTAVALVFLLVGTVIASDVNVQNEQVTRLQAIKSRAQAKKLTIGDMHESGAHLRVVAARLRDAGFEPKIDGYVKNKNNAATIVAKCVQQTGRTKAVCQGALSMLTANGSHLMLQAAASVAYNVSLWGRPIPTGYDGGARLLPIFLPLDCRGVDSALALVGIIGSAELLIPGAEPAGGVTLLFGAILTYARFEWC